MAQRARCGSGKRNFGWLKVCSTTIATDHRIEHRLHGRRYQGATALIAHAARSVTFAMMVCGAALSITECSARPTTSPVPLALWVGGVEDPNFDAAWDNFVKVMGRTPEFNITYVDVRQPAENWASYAQWQAGVMARDPRTKDVIPFIGWGLGTEPDGSLFTKIADGDYDDQITGALANWKAAGYGTLYLRPGWEMNQAYPWKVSKQTAADFVAAFKHFVTLVRDYAATNDMKIVIVWNPNVHANREDRSVTVADIYPGASYVDILAIDFYSEPVDRGWERHSPADTTSNAGEYWVSTMIEMAERDNKPIAFGEIGGTNPAFIRDVISVLNSRPKGVQIALMGVWDINDSNGVMSFTNPEDGRDDLLAVWRSGFGPEGSVHN